MPLNRSAVPANLHAKDFSRCILIGIINCDQLEGIHLLLILMATKVPAVSKRNSGNQHLVMELLRPTRWELTSQQSADLSGLGVEHFGQDFCVVAMPGQPWLQFIDVLRQDVFNYLIGFWPTL
jgi:hypothetical protein